MTPAFLPADPATYTLTAHPPRRAPVLAAALLSLLAAPAIDREAARRDRLSARGRCPDCEKKPYDCRCGDARRPRR